MAEQLKNWAVDAVDPPKKGTSYTILPNRHGYLNRKVKLPHIDDASPPVTPLNVSSKPRTKGTVPNVSPVKESKKADTVRRTTPSAKVKGIELLRSTPPVSLELPPNSSMYLPPINPSERYRKHRDDQHQKPGKSGPDPTVKDIKNLQGHFAADDSKPGTSRQGSHVQGLPSSKVKDLSSSHLRLQNKIIKKRRQLRKLTSMRSRLNVEEEMTRLELDELEKSYHRSPTGRSERQSGGANITLSRIESKIQNGISTDLDALLKALRENNLTFLNEDQKSLDSPNPSESCPLVTETEKGSDADTAETYLDNTSSKACESAMTHIFDIPIPCQLRNPLASTAELKYFMPCDHYPTNFAVSQPSVGSPKICHLVSSAQRALYTRFVSNPLDVERLVRSKNESTEVSLNAPRAQFSTIACEDKELLRLTVTKPHVTRMETDKELDVSRAPVRCPDYNCQRMSFVSDFNTHMWHNHRSLAMECIRPGHTNTFLLDTNITLLDKPKCHMVYMVRDKIIDSQAEDLKDLLPVLLMSARTHWANSFGYSEHWDAREVSEENPIPDKEFLVLWLTGVVPRDMKLLATISVWSTLGPQMADCVDVNTGYIYDIREPSEVGRIVRSRSSMILPMSMISQMTDNGSRFLPVQVKIH